MKKVTIGVVVAVSALLGANVAAGGSMDRADIEVESRISLKIKKRSGSDLVVFSGRVRSDEQACLAERRVRLVRKGGETIGKTETRENGKYRFKESRAALDRGRYRASVRSREISQGGDTITCESDRSKRRKLKGGKGDGKPDFKPTKTFDAEVALQLTRGSQGDAYTPPGEARFHGTVRTNKQFCTRNREVLIHLKGVNQPGTTVTTDRSGEFELFVSEPVTKGEYRARALRKIREGDPDRYRKGRKLVCQPGRSNVEIAR